MTLNHEGHHYIYEYDDEDRDNAVGCVMRHMREGTLCPYAAGMLTFLILSVGEEEETD